MLILMDLVYHSVLYITFNGDVKRGWIDALVIGDPGQGKREVGEVLLNFYELGERIDLKGATEAGLKGGLQAVGKRWFTTWGANPLNDRGLVIHEEVKGAKPEVLGSLTDMRTTGIAQITKIIGKRVTHARTRKLWISNQRSDRGVATYNQGVLTIKELFGALEDIRRLDVALVVSTGEVSNEIINQLKAKEVPRKFSKEFCQKLILWGWSRTPEQVEFTNDAKELVLKYSNKHAIKYSASIPLVEPADHRYKLARLAAAVAVRTFSTDNGIKLIIRSCHVEWVCRWLEKIYDSEITGYEAYSKVQHLENTLTNPAEIKIAIESFPYPQDVVKGLLISDGITLPDIMDYTTAERDEARIFLSLLVRKNGLKRKTHSYYYKTSAFIDFLKSLDGKLTGTPTYVKTEF